MRTQCGSINITHLYGKNRSIGSVMLMDPRMSPFKCLVCFSGGIKLTIEGRNFLTIKHAVLQMDLQTAGLLVDTRNQVQFLITIIGTPSINAHQNSRILICIDQHWALIG